MSQYFAYKAFSRLKDAFKIEHQQTRDADQNEQIFKQVLLGSEISHIEILQILIFLTNVTPIISCGIDKAHEGLELKL